MSRYTSRPFTGFHKRNDSVIVHPNLAVTPPQMLDMASHGIPIHSQINESLFSDDADQNTKYIPAELRRGANLTTVWSSQCDARKKFASVKSVSQTSTNN